MKCCRWPDKQRTDLHAHLTQQNSTSLVGSSFSTHETGSKGRHGKAHKSQNQTLRQKPLERQCLTKSHRQTGTDRRENMHTRYSGRGRQWDTAEALVWGRKSTHLKQEERGQDFQNKDRVSAFCWRRGSAGLVSRTKRRLVVDSTNIVENEKTLHQNLEQVQNSRFFIDTMRLWLLILSRLYSSRLHARGRVADNCAHSDCFPKIHICRLQKDTGRTCKLCPEDPQRIRSRNLLALWWLMAAFIINEPRSLLDPEPLLALFYTPSASANSARTELSPSGEWESRRS